MLLNKPENSTEVISLLLLSGGSRQLWDSSGVHPPAHMCGPPHASSPQIVIVISMSDSIVICLNDYNDA